MPTLLSDEQREYLLKQSWPSKVLQALAGAATLPGEVAAGGTPTIERVFDLADIGMPAAIGAMAKPVAGKLTAGFDPTDIKWKKAFQEEKFDVNLTPAFDAISPKWKKKFKDWDEPPVLPQTGIEELDEFIWKQEGKGSAFWPDFYAEFGHGGKTNPGAADKYVSALQDAAAAAGLGNQYELLLPLLEKQDWVDLFKPLPKTGAHPEGWFDVAPASSNQSGLAAALEALLGETKQLASEFDPAELAGREARRIAGGYTRPAVRGSKNPATREMRTHYNLFIDHGETVPSFYFYPPGEAERGLSYGPNLQPYWLREKNPAVIDWPRTHEALASRPFFPQTFDELERAVTVHQPSADVSGMAGWNSVMFDQINALAHKAGKDLVEYRNVSDVGGSGQTQLVTFGPGSAKSQFARRFDPNDPDVLMSLLGSGGSIQPLYQPTESEPKPLTEEQQMMLLAGDLI